MSMVLLAVAKAQSRNLSGAEDALVQAYLDAAELHAQKYLNRNVYLNQGAWDADRAHLTDSTAKNAQDAYTAAIAAIPGATSPGVDTTGAPFLPAYQDVLAKQKADEDFKTVQDRLARILYGMVISPTFTQAIILIVASWFVNREAVITELGDAIELPWGAKNLLSLDRRQLGV